jgi:hypothetical protein
MISHIVYFSSCFVLSSIARRFGVARPEFLSVKVSAVAALGVHIIRDSNRYDGRARDMRYQSRVVQTIIALITAAIDEFFCKTTVQKIICFIASAAFLSGIGEYYKLPRWENIGTNILLSSMPCIIDIPYYYRRGS